MNNYDTFIQKTEALANTISSKQDEITILLGKYEPYETARDEIARSISCLEGAKNELYAVDHTIDDLTITTFFPLNLPLYSLVIFAIMPGFFAENLYVRAPQIMQNVMNELVELLGIKTLFPNIKIKNDNRTTFLKLYAQYSDVILFTGKYENAVTIQEQCPEALFIFNGGGVNPAIVFEDADVDLAARKIYEMRTFNSGQDCAGTDVIFIHKSALDEFSNVIGQLIKETKISKYGDPETQIGPILKADYVADLVKFLDKEKPHILIRGRVDTVSNIVHPSLIVKDIAAHAGAFHEFFAPVFYVLVFESEAEVLDHLTQQQVLDYSMYITYFGTKDRFKTIASTNKILKNHIINDVEQGNEEYGGYGSKANFIAFGTDKKCRPILISREINNFYANDALA